MKKAYQIKDARTKQEAARWAEWLVGQEGQLLLPLLEVLSEGGRRIDDVLQVVGRGVVEALLKLSAQEVAGPKQRGQRGEGVYWWGEEGGVVPLRDRPLRVTRPRLRKQGRGAQEVAVPVYEALQAQPGMSEHVLAALVRGVSTRNYHAVLPEAADAVGIQKSSVSRAFIEASAQELQAVLERRFDEVDLLIVYLDGLVLGKQHVVCALGVDADGHKHVLGLREGASEHTEVVVDLLADLVARGVNPKRRRLFVIDGSKALRKAIDQVFGAHNPVQRCRAHKLRNVLGYLPKDLHEQTRITLKAAWRLAPKDGIAKLKQYAEWLRTEHHGAADSLLEGLDEMFTVNQLGLSPALRRGLCTTNIIESVHSGVRGKLPRGARWRSADMARRWVAATLLATERKLRRLMGYADLWMLAAVLADTQEEPAAKAA